MGPKSGLDKIADEGTRQLKILLGNMVQFSDSIHTDRVKGLVDERKRPILEISPQIGLNFTLPPDVLLHLYRAAVWDYISIEGKHEIHEKFPSKTEVVDAFLNVKRYLENGLY